MRIWVWTPMTHVTSCPSFWFHYGGGRNSSIPGALFVTIWSIRKLQVKWETLFKKNGVKVESDWGRKYPLLASEYTCTSTRMCAHKRTYSWICHAQVYQLIHSPPDILRNSTWISSAVIVSISRAIRRSERVYNCMLILFFSQKGTGDGYMKFRIKRPKKTYEFI